MKWQIFFDACSQYLLEAVKERRLLRGRRRWGGCRPLVCDHQPAQGCMTTDSSALVNTFTTCTFLLQWNIFIYITRGEILVEVLHLRQAVLKTQASRWGRRPSRLAWVLSMARLKCKTFFEYCEPAHIVLACMGCIIYLLYIILRRSESFEI